MIKHAREKTVKMLNVAILQIQHSMTEGNGSVDSLINSFMNTVERINSIEAAVENLNCSGQARAAKDHIEADCEVVKHKVQEAIMAFQFYDKLTQRLSQVSDGLAGLSEIADDENKIMDESYWIGLQEKIRTSFTVEQDRIAFHAILDGESLEKALEIAQNYKGTPEGVSGDEIELF